MPLALQIIYIKQRILALYTNKFTNGTVCAVNQQSKQRLGNTQLYYLLSSELVTFTIPVIVTISPGTQVSTEETAGGFDQKTTKLDNEFEYRLQK